MSFKLISLVAFQSFRYIHPASLGDVILLDPFENPGIHGKVKLGVCT